MTKPIKKQVKSDKTQVIQRVSEIKALKLQGQTRSDIQRYATNQGWGVGVDQVDKYIGLATAEIQEIAQADAQADISLILRNLWDIINANKINNPAVARQALMDIAKLRGMDQITINHTFKRDEKLASLSEDDFERVMAEAIQERH